MKKILIRNIVLLFTLVFLAQHVLAEKYKYEQSGGSPEKGTTATKAEACSPAKAFNEININNVRARINTGGDMWWDLQGNPIYEIPKGSKKHSMFSAALWLGGKDANGVVRVAGQRYRGRGDDYFTGPLTTDGTASVTAQTCREYDKHWELYRKDVQKFVSWFKEPALYPDFTVPEYFYDYPAHGDVSQGYSFYLAPFYDNDGDYVYTDPAVSGDYPYYDIEKKFEQPGVSEPTMEGNGIMADQILKGDQTLWWVFNDKGNIHSETRGEPIGMEIRAQAFSFATNDEINNMTFYSYELINRSTYSLDSMYMSQWVDTDVGYAKDDYVGCDIERGLGYCYNGETEDGTGQIDHYGAYPPAIGVDFFQGPYMEPDVENGDTLDRPKYDTVYLFDPITGEITDTTEVQKCDASINGINFQDGIPGNERYGMRAFVYHNNSGGDMGDPRDAEQYYNMLRGKWKNGQPMYYGGDAFETGVTTTETVFMFPGDTDPCFWGTEGIDPGYTPPNGEYWTEANEGNNPDDRRFMQSAGPFTLEPGAVNYITVGIPWARVTSGSPWDAVERLRLIDDKCQTLFEVNFRIIDGPDAPEIIIQEFDQKLILMLDNPKSSNNYKGEYVEHDYNIKDEDSLRYFEGYQIYQLKNADVTIGDLEDPDLARLVGQCDIENEASRLINFIFNEDLSLDVPQEMVDGANKGIKHSFVLTEDAFTNQPLVNHKKYYYIAVAYAYNNFKPFIPSDPSSLDGQKIPYLRGRKHGRTQGQIFPVTAIPHIPGVENGGTILHAEYGNMPSITRIEGTGNGGLPVKWSSESVDELLAIDQEPYRLDEITYETNHGPIDVRIVDPLSVKEGDFTLKFLLDTTNNDIDSANWMMIDHKTLDTLYSHRSIAINYEQLILDYGMAITIAQPTPVANAKSPRFNLVSTNAVLEAEKSYETPGSLGWLNFLGDNDVVPYLDWIRAGIDPKADYYLGSGTDRYFFDGSAQFENVLDGQWAPYGLSAKMQSAYPGPAYFNNNHVVEVYLAQIPSIMVVFTSDKSKWTRSPVIELSQTNDETEIEPYDPAYGLGTVADPEYPSEHSLRAGRSIDKDGNIASDTVTSTDPNHPNYISSFGMGWFPGYAIDLETGYRLNIIYGEASMYSEENGLIGETGRDMMWNPTSTVLIDSMYSSIERTRHMAFGGRHYIYVMGKTVSDSLFTGALKTVVKAPAYDAGKWIFNLLDPRKYDLAGMKRNKRKLFTSAVWTAIPYLREDVELLEEDLTIRINVKKPYAKYFSPVDTVGVAQAQNDNYPMYTFNTEGLGVVKGDEDYAETLLDLINIVPNPYYAYSTYEISQFDNRVKFTNLPDKCSISVYNMSGTLIREFTKDDNTMTSLEWDLKNYQNIPIASGVYLVHVKADGVGEKILKFFCTMRATDMYGL